MKRLGLIVPLAVLRFRGGMKLTETPEYVEFQLEGGGVLRVVYEMSVGDLLITTFLVAAILYLIIQSVIRMLWRW